MNYIGNYFGDGQQQYMPLLIGLYAAIIYVTVWFGWSFYNTHLHALAKFPGPRQAALSKQWMYEQHKKGFPEAVLEELHRQYNTKALRIGPNELHITDVDLYRTIYSQSKPFPKEPAFYEIFQTPGTLFAEHEPSLHKERRKLLNPLFARSGITELEPVITETVDKFIRKVRRLAKKGSINVYDGYRCVTVDVISRFAFGRSTNLLNESPDSFSAEFLDVNDKLVEGIWEMYFKPVVRYMAMIIPLPVAVRFNKHLSGVLGMHQFAYESLMQYKNKTIEPSHPVIFDHLRSLTVKAQSLEAVDILVAGADTTAFTLCIASYHITRNKAIKERLMHDLKDAIPNAEQMPSLVELEQIPYLYACVKEALRVAMPVPGRLPRIVPKSKDAFVVDGKIVPPGTVVGMSTYTMHNSAKIWGPDAQELNTDRWIGSDGKRLNDHLCTFSKGARSCIGVNIAHAEIFLVLARLYRFFDATSET
ncbi:hypothetical protein BOTNAR_0785g00010 [Botryotinia narcissicola]|uniref:Uncharacterized protein n=1 Tax=Botryotinia narcissicola TaxID=278944 RepID=A0A4Z1H706_9HELO|nr:hypothetical protein BOTNAR_0785g00010 [Botryotinia narcissicola]